MVKIAINNFPHETLAETDAITVFDLFKGTVSGACLSATTMICQMKAQFTLNPAETLVLGHGFLSAVLVASRFKPNERIILHYETNGIAHGFHVEAFGNGSVRGYLLNDITPHKASTAHNLSELLGSGFLRITKYLEGVTTPSESSILATHHNIALDLAEYFLISEELQCNFNTSIQFDRQGGVVGAGAFYVASSVHTAAEIIDPVNQAFAATPSLGQWIYEGGKREDLVFGLFRGMSVDVKRDYQVSFSCPCSAKHFFEQLARLPPNEIADLYQNGNNPIQLYCHNCASTYSFGRKELEPLIQTKQKKNEKIG